MGKGNKNTQSYLEELSTQEQDYHHAKIPKISTIKSMNIIQWCEYLMEIDIKWPSWGWKSLREDPQSTAQQEHLGIGTDV